MCNGRFLFQIEKGYFGVMKNMRLLVSTFLLGLFLYNSVGLAGQRDFVMLYQFTKTSHDEADMDRKMYPILPVKLSYGARFSLEHNDTTQPVPESRVMDNAAQRARGEMAQANHDFVILDIETWRVDKGATRKVFDESLQKYVETMVEMKKRLPEYRVGNYGKPVHRDYHATRNAVKGFAYQDWENRNTRLMPLADVSDVFYPSLYSFHLNDIEGWKRYAKAHIDESRRLARHGQPVIAFIWPMYHDRSHLKGRFIDYDFWMAQLETLWEIADGVVIWSDHRGGLDENASWYRATRDFVEARLQAGSRINSIAMQRSREPVGNNAESHREVRRPGGEDAQSRPGYSGPLVRGGR